MRLSIYEHGTLQAHCRFMYGGAAQLQVGSPHGFLAMSCNLCRRVYFFSGISCLYYRL